MGKPATAEEVDGPAILSDRFAKDRKLSKVAGSGEGYRALFDWDRALDQGRLNHGSDKYSARQRAQAWSDYNTLWIKRYPSGRDSSQGLSVTGGRMEPGCLAAGQIDAMRVLEALEGRGPSPYKRPLGQRDAIIIKLICGEGATPSEAVRLIQPSYRYAVWPRFCEALDSLIEAFTGGRS
jgi:hypothetical protein